MSREQEAINLLCLVTGALKVLAPSTNEPLQALLKDIQDWLNEGQILVPEEINKTK